MRNFQMVTILFLQHALLRCQLVQSDSLSTLRIFDFFLPQPVPLGFDMIFVLQNTRTIVPSFSNWTSADLAVVVDNDENSILKGITTNFRFSTQTYIVINPSKLSTFLSQLRIIRNIYTDSATNRNIWKPTFFLALPSFPETPKNSSIDWLSNFLLKENISKDFHVDSDIYIIHDLENQSKTYMSELYHLNGVAHVKKLPWKNESKDFTFLLQKATRRGNFNQTKIKAVAMVDPNYRYQCQAEYIDGKPTRFLERCGNNVLNLKTTLNFTYEAILATGWTNILANGSLTGIGRQVQDGEADIAVTSSINLKFRSQKLLFLHPNEKTSTRIYFMQPEASTLRDIYTRPFRRDTWLCILLAWAFIIMGIKFMIKMGNFLHNRNDSDKDCGALLFSIGAISQQGWHASPTSTPVRIAVVSSLLFGLVIYVAFSASLVSNLSNENIPIKSLGQLLSSGFKFLQDISLYSSNVSFEAISNSSNAPTTQNVTNGNGVYWVNLEDGVQQILKKPSALTCFPDPFRAVLTKFNYTDQFYCEKIYSFEPAKAIYYIGMFLRKGSPYKELFNHRIALMKEVGVNMRVNSIYRIHANAPCIPNIGLTRETLGIMDLFSAYIILVSGYGISLAVIFLEKIWTRSMGTYMA